jgi:hypothetical protein
MIRESIWIPTRNGDRVGNTIPSRQLHHPLSLIASPFASHKQRSVRNRFTNPNQDFDEPGQPALHIAGVP